MTTGSTSAGKPQRLITRRRFLGSVAGAAVAATAVGAYAFRYEPANLRLERVDLALPGLGANWVGKRMVQLSDLHASEPVSPHLIARAFAMAAACEPDMVVLTGDYVTNNALRLGWIEEGVRGLAQRWPVVATLGNHDYCSRGEVFAAREVADRLRGAGARLLRNESLALGGLTLVGLDDLWNGKVEPGAIRAAPAADPVIVLAHNPDTYDLVRGERWDVMLSGHTHGGQVVIPGIGPLHLPVQNKQRYEGWYALDGGTRGMYINRGVGHLMHVRVWCPPEVTCFTLRSAAQA